MERQKSAAADAPKGSRITNIGALLSRFLQMHGTAQAVRTSTASIGFLELERRSNRLANALKGMGLSRGDRVGVYLPNRIEVVELEIACYKAALAKTPINARLSPVEVVQVLANSGATVVVTTAPRAEAFFALLEPRDRPRLLLVDAADSSADSYEAALARASDEFVAAEVGRDDLAVLHYTSGSSGVLKAAMQTFGNRLAQWRKFLMRPDSSQRPGSILGLVGPITHASGMQLAPALCAGTTVRLFDKFDPEAFLRTMCDERITHTFLVPTMINMILESVGSERPALPDLQRMGYGAAPMAPARILQAMDVFGPVLTQGYGAGETTSAVCVLTVQDHILARERFPERLSSCGRPFGESLVEVVDDEGRPIATGEIGEIVVSGEDVFAGYWGAPGLTAEVLKDGRYHTGDLARVDEHGYLYIVDRKKDMVISGGFNVYPTEVEAVLYQHPAVAEACVFAVPDEKWGEIVGAHLVLRSGHDATTEDIDAFCADRLGGFKRPRLVRFVDGLPKNPNGKVLRKEVQAQYWSGRERKVN